MLYLGQGCPWYQSRLENEWSRAALLRRAWGCCWMRVWTCPGHMHWHPETPHTPWAHPQWHGQRVRRGFCPLACSDGIPPGGLHPALESSAQEGLRPVGVGSEDSMKMIRRLEHLCCGNGLSALRLFSLEKKRVWSDLIATFHYLKWVKESLRGTLSKGMEWQHKGEWL